MKDISNQNILKELKKRQESPFECSQHNRAFECYCLKCNTVICPSCLMFGDHKNHEVSSLEETTKEQVLSYSEYFKTADGRDQHLRQEAFELERIKMQVI